MLFVCIYVIRMYFLYKIVYSGTRASNVQRSVNSNLCVTELEFPNAHADVEPSDTSSRRYAPSHRWLFYCVHGDHRSNLAG